MGHVTSLSSFFLRLAHTATTLFVIRTVCRFILVSATQGRVLPEKTLPDAHRQGGGEGIPSNPLGRLSTFSCLRCVTPLTRFHCRRSSA